MDEAPSSKSWWQTLPGIFTAIAGFITAVTGLVIGLHQAGILGSDAKTAPQAPASVQTSSSVNGANDTNAGEGPSKAEPQHPARDSVKDALPGSIGTLPAVGGSATPGAAQATQAAPEARPNSARINLLSPENGGQIILAPSSEWLTTIDGKENAAYVNDSVGSSTVYAFKDERIATIDTFAILIDATSEYNVKEFELSVSPDSPTGNFQAIGKFQTQNIRLFKTPYQEFRFAPVKVKYLKFKLISNFGTTATSYVYEFRLFGKLS